MKKRILIINRALEGGGVDKSLIQALEVIDPEKFDVTLYVHTRAAELASCLPSYVELVVNNDANH
ncbi:MAG: glycosyltransferase, partial [Clostridia bacterium]|nr:glycosyltransferase [Clostridia bacterium]